MLKRIRTLRTDENCRIIEKDIKPGTLEANSSYVLSAIRPAKPARLPKAREKIVEWITECVLGDLRTLLAGTGAARDNRRDAAGKTLGGGNYLLAAGCLMAMEYLAWIYCGKEDSTYNVRQYTKKFLAKINPLYEQVIGLIWSSFRHGIVHGSWPQMISIEDSDEGRITVGVGIEKGDEHLKPQPGMQVDSFVINASQLLTDLERSVEDGLIPWIMNVSDQAPIERAGPRLLEVRPGNQEAVSEFRFIKNMQGHKDTIKN